MNLVHAPVVLDDALGLHDGLAGLHDLGTSAGEGVKCGNDLRVRKVETEDVLAQNSVAATKGADVVAAVFARHLLHHMSTHTPIYV